MVKIATETVPAWIKAKFKPTVEAGVRDHFKTYQPSKNSCVPNEEKNWLHKLISFSDGVHCFSAGSTYEWTIDLAIGMVVFSQFHPGTGTRTDGLDCASCLALLSENRPTILPIRFLFVAFVKADAGN